MNKISITKWTNLRCVNNFKTPPNQSVTLNLLEQNQILELELRNKNYIKEIRKSVYINQNN